MGQRTTAGGALAHSTCAGLALWLAAGGAAAQSGTADATVAIHPARFLFAGTAFDDLDSLERRVMPRTPRSVGLYACGAGTATPLKAAAHRFRNLALDLRVLDADAPPCRAEAGARPVAVSLVPDAGPKGADDEEVIRWWRERMP